ncbi:hypothetical protein [Legionella drancourtii]|uniref:Inclusion membrane protein A n=1 Tax=Legionella drancourtii LLAP12 TaxID=658187 RepID=G9EQF3_9GAMM|nr:hypothetical protein [Legionella drancourtii]EHL30548.1 hypothetical protein LDG_7500 [Legionella drancourtii LLAP12]
MTPDLQTETNPTQPKPEHLQQIITTHQHLTQIQKDLEDAIDSFAANQSVLARIAAYWAKIPLWVQVSSGLAVLIPLIVLSITLQLAALLTLSIFALLAYTVGSYLLFDYHQNSTQSTNKFKTIIVNFSDLLVNLIDLIDALHAQFKTEVDQLAVENMNLTNNVSRLNSEINQLTGKIATLNTTEGELRVVRDGLNKTLEELKGTSGAQSVVLQQTQAQLNEVQQKYEQNHSTLSERIEELETLRSKLETDLKIAKNLANTLSDTVTVFTGTLRFNEEQRTLFLAKLHTFIDDEKLQFDQITQRMLETQKNLTSTLEETRSSNNHYAQMIEYQDSLIKKLEKVSEITDKLIVPKAQGIDNSITALKHCGVFSGSAASAQASNELLFPETRVLQVH